MNYHGKLYGKVGGKYFDTGRTTDEFDKAVNQPKEDHLTDPGKMMTAAEYRVEWNKQDDNYYRSLTDFATDYANYVSKYKAVRFGEYIREERWEPGVEGWFRWQRVDDDNPHFEHMEDSTTEQLYDKMEETK